MVSHNRAGLDYSGIDGKANSFLQILKEIEVNERF
jgi:hypothetical protein